MRNTVPWERACARSCSERVVRTRATVLRDRGLFMEVVVAVELVEEVAVLPPRPAKWVMLRVREWGEGEEGDMLFEPFSCKGAKGLGYCLGLASWSRRDMETALPGDRWRPFPPAVVLSRREGVMGCRSVRLRATDELMERLMRSSPPVIVQILGTGCGGCAREIECGGHSNTLHYGVNLSILLMEGAWRNILHGINSIAPLNT